MILLIYRNVLNRGMFFGGFLILKKGRGDGMTVWNKESAPNNNLSPKTIRSSKLLGKQGEMKFSGALSNVDERDPITEMPAMENKK